MKDVMYGRTARKSFAHIDEILDMPNLLEVQKKSYEWFLASGLREVLQDAGTIEDYSGNLELSFIDYTLDEKCKYSVEECKERDTTYAAPLRVKVRLRNKETEEIKEQEIFMGDFPVMTKTGTFVINGAERVIVSQIVRSPGMYFDAKMDKADSAIYSATVIPYRGAWLEYETDLNDIFSIRIDKNRKLPVTSFIRALGLATDTQIKEVFGEDDRIVTTLDKDTCKTEEEALIEIYKRLRPGEPPTIDGARTLINNLFFDERRYDLSMVGRYKYNKKMNIARRIANKTLREPAVDPRTGEILAEAGEILSREKAEEIARRGVNTVVLDVNDRAVKVFGNGMVDINDFVDFDAKELGITEKVRFTVLCELIDNYEGDELRAQIVERMGDLIPKHIIIDDIFASINYLNGLAYGIGTTDDIDHLGNRRLRSVGELLQNQFRIGCNKRILRFFSALSVYGSEQPAC